jgi:hypothetical protein
MTGLKVIDGGDNGGSSSPELVEPVDEQEAAFDRAYSEYLSAEAAIAKFNAGDRKCATEEENEEMNGRLCDRRQVAQWRLIRTPAFTRPQFIDKFGVLEAIICRAEDEGDPTDKRHVFMLTSLKADLWRFNFKRYSD